MHSIVFAATVAIQTIVRAIRDDRGATAIEYGLIVALVVIAMIVGLTSLADTTTGLWNNVAARVMAAR